MVNHTAEAAIAAYLAGDIDGVRAAYAPLTSFLGLDDSVPPSSAHDDTCYGGEATINETTITGCGV